MVEDLKNRRIRIFALLPVQYSIQKELMNQGDAEEIWTVPLENNFNVRRC